MAETASPFAKIKATLTKITTPLAKRDVPSKKTFEGIKQTLLPFWKRTKRAYSPKITSQVTIV